MISLFFGCLLLIINLLPCCTTSYVCTNTHTLITGIVDFNENYCHSTTEQQQHQQQQKHETSKYLAVNGSTRASNYLNPTFNSKINLCINDDYISLVDNSNHHQQQNNNQHTDNKSYKSYISNTSNSSKNNKSPPELALKRESRQQFDDENMNSVTPLISVHDLNVSRKIFKGKLK